MNCHPRSLHRAIGHRVIGHGAIGALLFALPACKQQAPRVERPIPVVVAEVRTAALPLELQAVGTVDPILTVAIRAQVSGVLVGLGFEEGQLVRAGQVLFRIDPRPFEIALKHAEATAARDRFAAQNARSKATRYEGLAKKSYVPEDQYETLSTAAGAADAVLAINEAALARARLELEYATIRAPITGRTGTVFVGPHNLVRANDQTPIVVIHQLDPILIRFAVPEAELPLIQRRQAQGPLPVRADLQGGPLEGVLVFIDNAIDPATATINLKARFPNADGRLWPGRSAGVRLLLETQADQVVVPSQAVQMGQAGPFVFTLASGNTVAERPIAISRTTDGLTAVLEGIRPGERVVVDGQLKLTSGARVEPRAAEDRS